MSITRFMTQVLVFKFYIITNMIGLSLGHLFDSVCICSKIKSWPSVKLIVII